MKKQIIISFLSGAVLFGSIGVFAGQYMATENMFPVQLNGKYVSIEGYNINNSTYFKLRDIADTVGGFTVNFQNNIIQLSKDGYIYNNTQSVEEQIVSKFKETFNVSDDANITITVTDMGDYYTVNAKQYTGDPDFLYDEWGCMVDKDTLEFYNFAG